MRHAFALLLTISLAASAALADGLPPGLQSARLLPGWTDAEGNRVAALELRLRPGWKTYWRQPGDTGLPPSFDWGGSQNLDEVVLHWPAPVVIDSGGEPSLGYHDLLVLPFTARPLDAAAPLILAAEVELGLCENICVPARLDLRAPAAGKAPDRQISAALARVPATLPAQPECRIETTSDGIQVDLTLAQSPADATAAAIELVDRPEIWVAPATLVAAEHGLRVVADLLAPSGMPFALDPEALRLTLISPAGAVEMRGCASPG